MKKMTATKWVILVLAVLTACVAVAYLAGRPQVPEQTIQIEYNGKTVDVDIARNTEIHDETGGTHMSVAFGARSCLAC